MNQIQMQVPLYVHMGLSCSITRLLNHDIADVHSLTVRFAMPAVPPSCAPAYHHHTPYVPITLDPKCVFNRRDTVLEYMERRGSVLQGGRAGPLFTDMQYIYIMYLLHWIRNVCLTYVIRFWSVWNAEGVSYRGVALDRYSQTCNIST